jgi:GNAT superfamily N-acetyltransferase
MTRIVEGSVVNKWVEVAELLAMHVDELASHKHLMKLDPAIETYEAMEDGGMLASLFVYDENEKLIGYSVNFIVPHLHYSELVTCQNDVLFIHPDHRHGRIGMRLIAATEQLAKERGAKLISWHVKENTTLQALMPRLGYKVQEITYMKET